MHNRLSPFSLLPLAAALAVTSAMAVPGSTGTSTITGMTGTATAIMPVTPTVSTTTTTPTTSGTTTTGTTTTGTSSTGTAPAAPNATPTPGRTSTATNTTLATTGRFAFPILLDNGMVATAGDESLNGERVGNPAGVVAVDTGANLGVAASEIPQVGIATSSLAATDPSVRKELRKRQTLKRNGQLLYSIAPRTNVDRGWQMPDDPPSPALRPPAG